MRLETTDFSTSSLVNKLEGAATVAGHRRKTAGDSMTSLCGINHRYAPVCLKVDNMVNQVL